MTAQVRPLGLAVALLLAAGAPAAQPDALVGRWKGAFFPPGDAVPVSLVLSGDATVPSTFSATTLGLDGVPVARVDVVGDTVRVSLGGDYGSVALRGLRIGEAVHGVLDDGAETSPLLLARSGTRAARGVDLLAQSVGPDADRADARSHGVVTSDIARFWDAFDAAPPDRAEAFHDRYVRNATEGLGHFLRLRVGGADALAAAVAADSARYAAVRATTLRMHEAVPAIRAALGRLEALVPEAAFPPVYIVVGRFTTAGTYTRRSVLIGAEMFDDPQDVVPVAVHEVVHTLQQGAGLSLLGRSILEGSADFVTSLALGRVPDERLHAYGDAHERALWEAFRRDMHGTDLSGWLYGRGDDERPGDLGYYVGFKIAEAYYERADDPERAVRDILSVVDYAQFLDASGYADRFRAGP